MSIDAEMLKAYQRRWQAVAEIVAAERRQTSLAQRWKKLNALLRMARALGLPVRPDDGQAEIVRERWSRLRDVHFSRSLERPE